MAVRRWQVRPDVQVPTQEYGLVPAVSRGLIDQAFLDGAAMVANAGGVFSVQAGRHPTDLPQEMLTLWLVCEWKDRTDAKSAPEQPANSEAAGLERLASSPEIHEMEWPAADEIQADVDAQVEGQAVESGAIDSPDGLDPSALEEEDVSEIPASAL